MYNVCMYIVHYLCGREQKYSYNCGIKNVDGKVPLKNVGLWSMDDSMVQKYKAKRRSSQPLYLGL